MSLMQLLTVGRSLRGVKDEPSRYKMTEGSALPKFEAGRFDMLSVPPARMVQAELMEAARPKRHLAVAAPAPPAADRPSIFTAVVPARRSRTGWFGAMFRRGSSQAAAKAAWVQTELALDSIRVLRNDLAGADLELVRRAKEEPVRDAAPPQEQRSWWRRWLAPGKPKAKA